METHNIDLAKYVAENFDWDIHTRSTLPITWDKLSAFKKSEFCGVLFDPGKIGPFSGVKDSHLKDLRYSLVFVKPGQMIWGKDSALLNEVYFLINGECEVSYISRNDMATIFTGRPGMCIGEFDFFMKSYDYGEDQVLSNMRVLRKDSSWAIVTTSYESYFLKVSPADQLFSINDAQFFKNLAASIAVKMLRRVAYMINNTTEWDERIPYVLATLIKERGLKKSSNADFDYELKPNLNFVDLEKELSGKGYHGKKSASKVDRRKIADYFKDAERTAKEDFVAIKIDEKGNSPYRLYIREAFLIKHELKGFISSLMEK